MAPIIVDESKIKSFPTEAAFEAWLAEYHDTHKELWLRIYKRGSGVPTVTPVQAIDVALCWGWIDGVRKGLDEVSFLQRYTPRKKKSVWSQINRDNIARLIAAGRMTPHGQRHVETAQADGRWAAAYAPMRSASEATLPADLRAAIEANPRALAAVQKLGRANLFALAFRTNNMRTPAGRAKKVATLVAMLARGETIVPEASQSAKADGPSVGTSATKEALSSQTMQGTKTVQGPKTGRRAKAAQGPKTGRRAKAAQGPKTGRRAKAQSAKASGGAKRARNSKAARRNA
jgi:uncharacterized protein YdeI (YjbR/CyaY-like superfamily)